MDISGIELDQLIEGHIPMGAVEQVAGFHRGDPVELLVEALAPVVLNDIQRHGVGLWSSWLSAASVTQRTGFGSWRGYRLKQALR